MYTNLLNTNNVGNYTPKRNSGRIEYNSSFEEGKQTNSESQKLIKESEILNSTKIPTNLKIDGKVHPSSPVVKSRKTFKAILETIKQNPELFEDITIAHVDRHINKSAAKNPVELNSSDMGYIIRFGDNSGDSPKEKSPYLKQHKKVFENYHLHLRRDPGTLINVTI